MTMQTPTREEANAAALADLEQAFAYYTPQTPKNAPQNHYAEVPVAA
ncbi:hypothetical protein KO498_17125 [Lentibacter algarum]|nr:hypothetical protein [Lentibacter algarum]MBU2983532.1 hypothetical protein [Lentibacter algarum]